MPGNTTLYKSPRAYLPIVWTHNNIAVNADIIMAAAGLPVGLTQVPVAAAGSVTSIIVLLSEAVTNGTLTLTLRKNGSDTAEQVEFTDADGTTKVAELQPGAVNLVEGDTLGVRAVSSVPFAPAGQLDIVVYLELQNA